MSQEVTGVNGKEQDAVIADLQKERDLLKDDIDKMKDRFQVSRFPLRREKRSRVWKRAGCYFCGPVECDRRTSRNSLQVRTAFRRVLLGDVLLL